MHESHLVRPPLNPTSRRRVTHRTVFAISLAIPSPWAHRNTLSTNPPPTMGHLDIAPPHCPPWLIPASTALLGAGISLWLVTYALMVPRSLATKSSPIPLLALAINISWEVVFTFAVTESLIERLGFALWLLFDVGIICVTLAAAPYEWGSVAPVVGRNLGLILAAMVAVGCLTQWAFVAWWVAEPGRGHGVKTGKVWYGVEEIDTTELAYWTAGFAQVVGSALSLGELVVRGHSGGTSYSIWLARTLGSQCGLTLNSGILWWYWPEAHAYYLTPPSLFILGATTVFDLIYGAVLWYVRKTEKQLPDGRFVAGAWHGRNLGEVSKKEQ
ncbi:hypothetical protein jhhlp_000403 [Lomentospora prolificans]|uniref:Uncharacterized protein n=1 Tax=Lomentospora prolificans TaxID=41688 RepID=A0A2N3NL12_9PEZI|nr:hypothetical protein jhhlp_000403 [Lomentospora prolificans]